MQRRRVVTGAEAVVQRLIADAGIVELAFGPFAGLERGAVLAFRPVRFLALPAEPDVHVAAHPALHKSMSLNYDDSICTATHGEGMRAAR